MKANITDRDSLSALRPSEIAAYLRSNGWTEDKPSQQTWVAFTRDDYEIALPLSNGLRDFALRISEALRTLEAVEQRDQLQILADLAASSSDVVRIRVLDQKANDGTLPLDRAVDIVRNAHDLMLAAACSAVDPKLFYPARKPARAVEYIRNVRMGQTERGSFVVTVVSRLPPELISTSQALALGLDEPFPRRVTGKLSDALSAVCSAATVAIASGNLESFESSVPSGVSANLCDALYGLSLHEGALESVQIDLAWARARPHPSSSRGQFLITPDVGSIFHEAAVVLRSKAPRDDFEVRGPVFRLHHPTGVCGEITVAATVDGVPRNIWMYLDDADYAVALKAHEGERFISATGTLGKDGRRYRLENPKNVRIAPDDDWLGE